MRHSLLSLFALTGAMFVSSSAFAQWAEPTAPVLNEVNAAAVESGHVYYIKNVGAGQFITGSNAWNTQISLTTGGVLDSKTEAICVLVSDTTHTYSNSQATGVTFRLNGTFTFNGRAMTNTYLFRHDTDGTAGPGGGFVDYNNQGHGFVWKVTKADNGYYRIQVSEGDTYFPDAANEYAGWFQLDGPIEVDEEGTLLNPDVTTTVQFNVAADDPDYNIDWMFIPAEEFTAQKSAYDLRIQLYNKYLEVSEQAEIEELEVDYSFAESIYNNAAATQDDITAAINDLSYQLNKARFEDAFQGGTADDPVEVTDVCLVNPNFATGDISGWTNTFSGKATNIGYQTGQYGSYETPDGHGYMNDGRALTGTPTNEDGVSAYLCQFIEAWRDNNSPYVIGDAELSQTVYGLPAGMYTLTCDAIAVYQWSNAAGSNPVQGVKLFIATDDGKEVFKEMATYNNNPEHFSITFVCPEGVKALTFGLKTESTTANWISADNFRIYYYGETEDSPEQLELKNQIRIAEDAEISEDDNANKDVLAAYVKALEDAKAVAESSVEDEQYLEAANMLKAALDEAKKSIQAYVTLQNLINEAQELGDQVYEAGFTDAATAIEDLYEGWEEAYEERTATTEEIDTLDGVAYKTMKEKIFGNIQPGTDISFLLENRGFTKGKGGTQLTAKDAVPGWVLNSGLIGEHRASIHNIETWHHDFDMSQTIPDLPAGVYDVTLQGFVRHDNTSDTEKTWLYGGITKASLIDLDRDVTQKVTTPIFGDDKPGLGDENRDNSRGADWGANVDEEGNTLYQCNGMTGAYYWFQETNPNTGELYYTNHIKVLHEKDGDLTIGIHCEAAEDWVIWDNFGIKYIGQDNSIVAQELEKALQQLNDLATAEEGSFLTAKANSLAEELPVSSQKAIDDDDADAMIQKIKEVTDAIDYIKAGNTLGYQLHETVNLYTQKVDTDLGDLVPTDETYAQLLNTWDETGDGDPSTLADNEAIEALIQQIKDGWVAFLMSGAVDATSDDPIDVTPVINNPMYHDDNTYDVNDGYNSTGWTSDPAGGDGHESYAECEFYDKNFNHFQTITGLTPGYYIVAVDGFYRAGWPQQAADALQADTMALNATMYAIGVDSIGIPMQHIFAGAQEEELAYVDEVTVALDTLVEDDVKTPVMYYIPNRMQSAEPYLMTGIYTNEIGVQVGEDGTLTIGVSKDVHIAGDWTIFTNWTLRYCGTEGLPDGVESIAASDSFNTQTGAKAIYNLAGQKVSKVQKGIYIIDGRKVAVK